MSSASMGSSHSELLAEESEPIIFMFTLPKEPETVIRSAFAIVDQREPALLWVSMLPGKCAPLLRFGMFIALPDIVGDESGDDCSARVEWCKFVAAREKSSPRDRLGSTLVGDPYVCERSSFGERGTRLLYVDVVGSIKSRGGICKERPRAG